MLPGSGSDGQALRVGAVLRGAQAESFDITGELGRGGMGVVLRARDLRSGREVALKLARPTTEQALLLRLEREGQLAARLSHPGIVRVHGAGTIGDRPYVAYELVEGARTLAEALPGLDLALRLTILRDVSRALGAAHALGVVHRDVKPENVLLGVDGRARVSDFGIATAGDVERLTVTGAFMGTAHYMAPEQLIGVREGIGPPADVWALGVTLYQCLTDALPFDGQSLIEVVGKISDGVLVPPRRLRPELPADLEAVCLKALARAPAERYAEAGALADDLERALEGRPVHAATRRGRHALVLAGAALLVLAGVGAVRHRRGPAADPAPTPDDGQGAPLAGAGPGADPVALRRLLGRGEARAALDGALAALPGAGPAAGQAAVRQVGAEAALACGEPEQALRLAGGLPEGAERVGLEARALLQLRRPTEAARRATDAPRDPTAALTRGRALLVAGDSGARTALQAAARLGAAVGEEEERLLPLLDGWSGVARTLERLGELSTQIERDRPDPRAATERLVAVVESLVARLDRPPRWLSGLPRRLQDDVWSRISGLLELDDPMVARALGRILALEQDGPGTPGALCSLCWWHAENGPAGALGPLDRLAAVDLERVSRPMRFAALAVVSIQRPQDAGGPIDEAELARALAARAAAPRLSPPWEQVSPDDARRHERVLIRRLESVIGERALALAWTSRRDAAARTRLLGVAREHLVAFRELERTDFGAERRTQERGLLVASLLFEADLLATEEPLRSLAAAITERTYLPDGRVRVAQVEALLQAGDLAGAEEALARPTVNPTSPIELTAQRAVLLSLEGDAAGAAALLDGIEGQPAHLLPWRSASETRAALAAGWRPGQRPWVE
jgi:hypothetical protein